MLSRAFKALTKDRGQELVRRLSECGCGRTQLQETSVNRTEHKREEEILLLRFWFVRCSHGQQWRVYVTMVWAYLPDFPVVSALCFLLELLPALHHFAIRKGYSIDPLQCLHLRIAFPIR